MEHLNWSVKNGDYQGGKMYDYYRKTLGDYSKRKNRSFYYSYAVIGLILLYISLMIVEHF